MYNKQAEAEKALEPCFKICMFENRGSARVLDIRSFKVSISLGIQANSILTVQCIFDAKADISLLREEYMETDSPRLMCVANEQSPLGSTLEEGTVLGSVLLHNTMIDTCVKVIFVILRNVEKRFLL